MEVVSNNTCPVCGQRVAITGDAAKDKKIYIPAAENELTELKAKTSSINYDDIFNMLYPQGSSNIQEGRRVTNQVLILLSGLR